MLVATFSEGAHQRRGPLALRPLSVLLGIVAQLLIIGCSGITQWFASLDIQGPRIAFRLPGQGARSTPVGSTLAHITKTPGFVLAGTSSW